MQFVLVDLAIDFWHDNNNLFFCRLGASISIRTENYDYPDKTMKPIRLIIAGSKVPSVIIKEARDNNNFIVKTEWIIECLVNGKKVNFGEYLY